LGDGSKVEEIVSKGLDAVFHLASTTGPKSSNDDPVADVANIRDSIQLFQLCVKHSVRKVVFTSSGGTVYGIPRELPIPEEHPTNPICSYGIVKLAIEKYLQCFHHLYGLPYAVLRLANVYGVRQDPRSSQGAVAVFLWRMIQRQPLTLWGDGTVVRDFIHVSDVARLCSRALHSDTNGVFNVGSGIGVTMNELLQLMADRLCLAPNIVREPGRRLDVPAVVLQCDKAKRMFSWQLQVGLNEGVGEVAEWLQTTGVQCEV
jgi:UDP-glucose 4-epimerase